jgi:hypothetical protein
MNGENLQGILDEFFREATDEKLLQIAKDSYVPDRLCPFSIIQSLSPVSFSWEEQTIWLKDIGLRFTQETRAHESVYQTKNIQSQRDFLTAEAAPCLDLAA